MKLYLPVLAFLFFVWSAMPLSAQESVSEIIDPKQKLIIKGVVLDNTTKKGVYDATVTLIGTNGTLVTIKSSKKGQYEFFKNNKTGEKYILPDEQYTINISKEGYESFSYTESTGGIYESETLENKVFLQGK